jgi:hypothetical protein
VKYSLWLHVEDKDKLDTTHVLEIYLPLASMNWSTKRQIWFSVTTKVSFYKEKVFWHSNSARAILDTVIWYLGIVSFVKQQLEDLIEWVNVTCERQELTTTSKLKYRERMISMRRLYMIKDLNYEPFLWDLQDEVLYKRIRKQRTYWDFIKAHNHDKDR